MKDTVTEDENESLHSRIEELEAELDQANARIRALASSQGHGVSSPAELALEAALQQARTRARWLARLPESNPNPVVRVSADGIVIYHNGPAGNLPGWKCVLDEPLPKPLLPFLEYSMHHDQALEEQVVLNGMDYWIYIAPFSSEGYAHIYGRNISERKHAEQEVAQSREQLRKLNLQLQLSNAELEIERARWQSVVEAIPDEVWACDAEGRMTLMNARAAAALDLDTFQPMPVEQAAQELEILDEKGRPRPLADAPLLRSLTGETLHGQEVGRDRRTGELRYRQYSTAPMRDGERRITGAVGVVQDITALKQTEKALAESRNRIRDILSSLGDGLMAIDREWKLIYVNEAVAHFVGQPADELVGRVIWELWPGLNGSPLETVYRQAMEKGIAGQIRAQGVVHTKQWYDISVYPSSEGITVYYIDKTEEVEAEEVRQQLQEENREQSLLLQAMYEADPAGIAVFTKHDLRFKFANQAYRELLPLQGRDPIGMRIDEGWPSAMGFRVMETYLPKGKENEPVTYEKITRRFPGGSVRHFSVHLRPMCWHGQAATLVVAWENTALENAKADLEDYAEKLKRSNQDLQEFATIASHDLQEPLRKVEAYGELLTLSAAQLDDRSREYVDRMRGATQRMRGMIEGLLQLARVTTQGLPFEPVDLNNVTKEVIADLDGQIRRTHGVVEVESLPTVEGDALQLHQLMQNLIGNALKYHQPDIAPVVKISSRQLANGVGILVEDNGIGFAQENAEQIFQPFRRLVGRSEYEGSGIGLAICKRIVERHRGQIQATSAPNQGSSFMVTLPLGKGPSQ